MSDYPDDWFRKLEAITDRPDLLTGVEMQAASNLRYWRGPPNPAEAAMIERLFRLVEDDEDGLQDPRRAE